MVCYWLEIRDPAVTPANDGVVDRNIRRNAVEDNNADDDDTLDQY